SPSLALRANLARSTKSSWKGITVAQMGAVIDTIIGTVIGGGLSSITKAGLKLLLKRWEEKSYLDWSDNICSGNLVRRI
ncbi:hypothetical protein ACXO1G_04755, partial [Lactobacillus delbrueckii subsp. bulgaricus]